MERKLYFLTLLMIFPTNIFVSEAAFPSGIILAESEQVSLETSQEILPPLDLSRRVARHLRLIRQHYPIVSAIRHEPKWIPGELIMDWISLNSDFGQNIQAINASEYGPINNAGTSGNEGSPDELFQFTHPYNPEILSKIIKEKWNYEGSPHFSSKSTRNSITFSPSNPSESTSVVYTIKDHGRQFDLMNNPGKIYQHVWKFKVVKSGSTYIVVLEEEQHYPYPS